MRAKIAIIISIVLIISLLTSCTLGKKATTSTVQPTLSVIDKLNLLAASVSDTSGTVANHSVRLDNLEKTFNYSIKNDGLHIDIPQGSGKIIFKVHIIAEKNLAGANFDEAYKNACNLGIISVSYVPVIVYNNGWKLVEVNCYSQIFALGQAKSITIPFTMNGQYRYNERRSDNG